MSEPQKLVHQQAEKNIHSTNISETNPAESCRLMNIPYELKIQILSYLRYEDRWALARTSKYCLGNLDIRQPKSFFTGVLNLPSIPRGGGARHRELVKLNELYLGLQGLDGPQDHDTLTSSTPSSSVKAPPQPCFSCRRFRSRHSFDYDQCRVGALHSTRHCVDCGVRNGLYQLGIPILMTSETTDFFRCERYMVLCTGCGKLANGQGCHSCGMCDECVEAAMVALKRSKNNLWQSLQIKYSCDHLRGLEMYKRMKDTIDRRNRYLKDQGSKGMSFTAWVAYWRLYADIL